MAAQASLIAAIDALVEQKTFSLDALDAVKAIRDKAKALDDLNARQAAEIVDKNAQRDALQGEVMQYRAIGEKLGAREVAVAKREVEITNLEKAKAVAEATSGAIKETVSLIFRNVEYRNTMMGQTAVAVSYPGGGGSAQSAPVSQTNTSQAG